jgi:hypothetical protein
VSDVSDVSDVRDNVVWRGVTGVDEDRAAGVGWRLLSASLGVRHLRPVDQHPSGTAGEVLSLLCHNILLFVISTHLHTYTVHVMGFDWMMMAASTEGSGKEPRGQYTRSQSRSHGSCIALRAV